MISASLAAAADTGGTGLPNGQFDVTATALTKSSPVPPRAKVTFYTGIKRSEGAARNMLEAVSDPDSDSYREFLSRKDIRRDYGADRKALKKVRKSAESYGLTLDLDATGVFAAVSGRASRMSRWLNAPLRKQRGSIDGLAAVLIQTRATHPPGLKKYVQGFVGQDIQAKVVSSVSAQATPEPPYSGVNEGTPRGCLPKAVPELSKYAYSYNQLRTAYGIDQLPAGKQVGKATRVAILAQGDGFSNDALVGSANCFNLPAMSFKRVATPGLRGQLPEGGEGDLDVQVVQSVLPAGSTVHVIESPGFDLRFFPTWATAFGLKHRPDVITTSYGVCEQQAKQQMPPGSRGLTEAVLVRLGLSGTSTFSAAGDRGSTDCINNTTGRGSKSLAVDYPASSRYVTSVGGTRLTVSADNKRTQEVVWNSQAAQPPVGPQDVGGGGGTSELYGRPWWQPRSLTKSGMRTVPDVAAHAANGPGWVLFTGTGADLSANLVGGTSAATPFTAAAVGVIAATERRDGQSPFGLIQPALYEMYSQHPEVVHDVTVGSNDLFDKGCCSATVGYDKASGLGAPKFEEWYQRLPDMGR